MADTVRKVNYCHVTVPARAGSGAKVLGEVARARINMLGFSGFPVAGGKAQLDFLVSNVGGVRRIAQRQGWKVSPAKKAFLIQGADVAGAVYRHTQKLADARIKITAADAVSSGGGRYGMFLWVKPSDYAKAAKALKAR